MTIHCDIAGTIVVLLDSLPDTHKMVRPKEAIRPYGDSTIICSTTSTTTNNRMGMREENIG